MAGRCIVARFDGVALCPAAAVRVADVAVGVRSPPVLEHGFDFLDAMGDALGASAPPGEAFAARSLPHSERTFGGEVSSAPLRGEAVLAHLEQVASC